MTNLENKIDLYTLARGVGSFVLIGETVLSIGGAIYSQNPNWYLLGALAGTVASLNSFDLARGKSGGKYDKKS